MMARCAVATPSPLAVVCLAVGEMEGMADLHVTQIKSTIGAKPKQRGTMRALGLRGIGQTNTLPDRPEIRGIIAKVPHLINVEEVES